MNHKIDGSSFKATAVALTSAVILTVILLSISSDNPLQSISFFFTGPFRNIYNLGNMLDEAGLLIFAGLGMSIAFRAGVFNLGGEGQVYAGATAAVLVSINMGMGRSLGIISALIAGILTGALIAGISGFLKKQWNTDELISSFLFSGIVIHLTDYLISGPFRDNTSFLVSTVRIPSSLFLNRLFGTSHFNISFFIALGILTIASAILWTSNENHHKLLFFQLLFLVTALWLTPALIGSHPFLGHAYKNLGLVSGIVEQGKVFSMWYLAWPGAHVLPCGG